MVGEMVVRGTFQAHKCQVDLVIIKVGGLANQGGHEAIANDLVELQVGVP